jgi:gluconate 2-dehydrogenase subunit 3-like protein
MASVAGQEFLAAWLPSAKVFAAASPGRAGKNMPGMGQAEDDSATAVPYVPRFFTAEEFFNIEILSEMIIPRDDKPGARDARVADYIDFLVFSAAEFEPAMQTDWKQGLALLERLCQKQFGAGFAAISNEQRTRLLTDMSLPESEPNAQHEGFPFFRLVKQATVEGFYTSRAGLMEALEYKGLTYLTTFPGCTHPEHQS